MTSGEKGKLYYFANTLLYLPRMSLDGHIKYSLKKINFTLSLSREIPMAGTYEKCQGS